MRELITMRASEYLRNHSITNKHLDIQAFDVDPQQFFAEQRLKNVISMDLERLGLGDVDVIALASSSYVHNLHWISLAGNADIRAAGVHSIARAVYEG